jgi:hypothetical protein
MSDGTGKLRDILPPGEEEVDVQTPGGVEVLPEAGLGNEDVAPAVTGATATLVEGALNPEVLDSEPFSKAAILRVASTMRKAPDTEVLNTFLDTPEYSFYLRSLSEARINPARLFLVQQSLIVLHLIESPHDRKNYVAGIVAYLGMADSSKMHCTPEVYRNIDPKAGCPEGLRGELIGELRGGEMSKPMMSAMFDLEYRRNLLSMKESDFEFAFPSYVAWKLFQEGAFEELGLTDAQFAKATRYNEGGRYFNMVNSKKGGASLNPSFQGLGLGADVISQMETIITAEIPRMARELCPNVSYLHAAKLGGFSSFSWMTPKILEGYTDCQLREDGDAVVSDLPGSDRCNDISRRLASSGKAYGEEQGVIKARDKRRGELDKRIMGASRSHVSSNQVLGDEVLRGHHSVHDVCVVLNDHVPSLNSQYMRNALATTKISSLDLDISEAWVLVKKAFGELRDKEAKLIDLRGKKVIFSKTKKVAKLEGEITGLKADIHEGVVAFSQKVYSELDLHQVIAQSALNPDDCDESPHDKLDRLVQASRDGYGKKNRDLKAQLINAKKVYDQAAVILEEAVELGVEGVSRSGDSFQVLGYDMLKAAKILKSFS